MNLQEGTGKAQLWLPQSPPSPLVSLSEYLISTVTGIFLPCIMAKLCLIENMLSCSWLGCQNPQLMLKDGCGEEWSTEDCQNGVRIPMCCLRMAVRRNWGTEDSHLTGALYHDINITFFRGVQVICKLLISV